MHAPLCTEAYGGQRVSDGVRMTRQTPRTRPPCWGVRTLCTVLQTLSDMGGGVNCHDVNLRDKCGVCDDVTG